MQSGLLQKNRTMEPQDATCWKPGTKIEYIKSSTNDSPGKSIPGTTTQQIKREELP